MKNNPNTNTDVSFKEENITNTQDPVLAPRIIPLCDERFLLSNPRDGSWAPNAATILKIPIPESVIPLKFMLINNNAMPIEKTVNARDGQVSLLDSGEDSLIPPMISATIVVEIKKINEIAFLLGGKDEI